MDSVSIHGLSNALAKNVADRYLQNQATVDLFRQWIAHKNDSLANDFLYTFDWKPVLSASDLANRKSSFRVTFGLDFDSIQVIA